MPASDLSSEELRRIAGVQPVPTGVSDLSQIPSDELRRIATDRDLTGGLDFLPTPDPGEAALSREAGITPTRGELPPKEEIIDTQRLNEFFNRAFGEVEPFAPEAGALENIRRLGQNIKVGLPRVAPMLAAEFINRPAETLGGLVTFIPEVAERVSRATFGQKLEKTPTKTLRGLPVEPLIEHRQKFIPFTPEERSQARQELFQDPLQVIFAGAFFKGLRGKAAAKQIKRQVETGQVGQAQRNFERISPNLTAPEKAKANKAFRDIAEIQTRGEAEGTLPRVEQAVEGQPRIPTREQIEADVGKPAVELPVERVKEPFEMTTAEFDKEFEFHGGPEEIKGGKLELGGLQGQDSGGIFTTDSKQFAANFPGTKKVHHVRVGNKNILDLTDQSQINKMRKKIGEKYGKGDDASIFTQEDFNFLFPEIGGKRIGADWATFSGYSDLFLDLGHEGVRVWENTAKNIKSTVLFKGGQEVFPPHREIVQQALAEGKTIPPEVLKDFPDLIKKPPISPEIVAKKPVEPLKVAEIVEKPVVSVIEAPLPVEPLPKAPFIDETAAKPPFKAQKPPAPVKKVAPIPPPKETIGLNKAEIQQIRKDFKLHELPKEDVKPVLETIQEAKTAGLDKTAVELADKVIATKQPISAQEHSGMVLKARELKQNHKESIKTQADLIKKGDFEAARLEQKNSAAILDQIDRITRASDLAGREVARSLNIRKFLADAESVELPDVLIEARANKGKPLTDKESARFKELTDKYEATQKELDVLRKEHESTLEIRAKELAESLAAKEIKKTKIRAKTEKTKSALKSQRDQIKKDIAAIGFRVNDITGVTAEGAFLVGKLAVNYIRDGAATLEQVVRLVKADIPELSARDIYESLLTKNPNVQRRARSKATKQVAQLKKQAQTLLRIDRVEKALVRSKGIAGSDVRSLEKALTELRSDAYESGIKAERLERGLQTINELQDMLANQRRPILKKRRKATDPEMQAIQDKIKTLRRELKVEDELANLNEQLRTGEFVVKEKPQPKKLPPELERKEVELRLARQRIRSRVREAKPIGLLDIPTETIQLMKSTATTFDFSGFFRQNVIPAVGRPVLAAKIFPKGAKAALSDFNAEKIAKEINDRPQSYLYRKSGLKILEIDGPVGLREEKFNGRFIQHIPGLNRVARASNRNMNTLGNLFRTELFDIFLRNNPNATIVELKAQAAWFNSVTGIGSLGKFAQATSILNNVLYSAKFTTSRFQTPYLFVRDYLPSRKANRNSKRVRKARAADMARFAINSSIVLGVAHLASLDIPNMEVGFNLNNSDFGKIRIGNTRFDIFGGFQQSMRLILRFGQLPLQRLGVIDTEKEINAREVIGRFASYKTAPIVNFGFAALEGKDIFGRETTVTEALARSTVPLIAQDVHEAFKDAGFGIGAAAGAAAFVGIGVNTFEQRRKRRAAR